VPFMKFTDEKLNGPLLVVVTAGFVYPGVREG